jgi:hypothetical protein
MKAASRQCAGLLVAAMLSVLLPACGRAPRFSYDFERDADLDNLTWKCRTLFRLSDRHAASGEHSLEVSFYPDPARAGGNYPGLGLEGFDPDWSGHRAVAFDVHNPGASSVRLSVRIDDREAPPYADRYNAPVLLRPGDNHVVIPLADLVATGTRRPLRLRHITEFVLFLANPESPQTLFFDRVRLE